MSASSASGIPDPCPGFAAEVLPRRQARFVARRKLWCGQRLDDADLRSTGGDPRQVRVLYLAHCTREKGLFDTLEGVALANQRLRERRAPVSLRLQVTGGFVTAAEKAEFEQWLAQPGMVDTVQYLGFVSGDQKSQLLREADLFCFPTYYENENQPVNLIEAMAFGLPIVTRDVDGCKEAIIDGVCGRAIAPRSVRLLTRAIADTVTDPARSFAYGEAARAAVIERSSLEATESAMLETILG